MKPNEHGSTQNLRKLGIAFTALSAASLFVLTGTAGAQGTAKPVTDYSTYPAALPSLCPQGGGALTGFDNGRGDTATALHDLDVRHGDTVTMSWTGFHSGCVAADGTPAITVGLAAYDSPTLRFDASVDQQLLDGWTACGAAGAACAKTGDRYTLSMTLPTTDVCKVQLDAHLGLPLAVVGPNGSYYSQALRGSGTNRLISAANFGLEPCVPPSTPTTVAAPTVTAPPETPTTMAPATPQETPVTEAPAAPEAPATPSTDVPAAPEAPATPTTVEAPLSPASPPSTAPSTTIAQTRVLNESVTAPARPGTLPITGSDTFGMLRIATWLATAGVGTLLAATVLRHRRQSA